MLEFSAREYIELTYGIGLVLGLSNRGGDADQGKELGNRLASLVTQSSRLGLPVTKDFLNQLVRHLMVNGKVEVTGTPPNATVRVVANDPETMSEVCHRLEALYIILRSEIGTMLFRAIPRDRTEFTSPEWLKKFEIDLSFPASFRELHRAGTCYALGQPTASAFHSMRALEPGLVAVAKAFGGISTAHDNWQTVIEQIESAARKLGQMPKTQARIDDETFFGSATAHLYFVKNAWRNHVMHARDSYQDDEAKEIMVQTAGFIRSLSPRLKE